MNDQTESLHILLGAFVLGGLSPGDRQAFSEHLSSCQKCRHELDQVAGIPRLLDLIAPSELGPASPQRGNRPTQLRHEGISSA